MNMLNEIKKKPPGCYFKKLDSYDLLIHVGKVRLFQLNLFKDDVKLRKAIFPLIILACVLWAIQGFDSSAEQIEYFVGHLPFYVMGQISWSQLVSYYTGAYGRYVHYSAFVIYMFFFLGISKYLRENLDVVNSQNVIASICFVALSVGLFEYFWMVSFCFLQVQPWVLSFGWPQARILLQNLFMIFVGLIFLLGIDWKTYKLNLSKWTLVLFSATIATILVWYFYGFIFPIQQINVQVQGYGTWTSSKFFAQTVYTVDTNILDKVVAGEQFWIQNDSLHLVNLLSKIFLTSTLYNLFNIQRK